MMAAKSLIVAAQKAENVLQYVRNLLRHGLGGNSFLMKHTQLKHAKVL